MFILELNTQIIKTPQISKSPILPPKEDISNHKFVTVIYIQSSTVLSVL
jgi:hypothetical protein